MGSSFEWIYGAKASADGLEFAYDSAADAIQGRSSERPVAGQAADRNPATGALSDRRPLRVIAVTPCLARGGAEQWLVYLSRFLNPNRATIVRTIVTDVNFVDPEFANDLPMPVEIEAEGSIERAMQECDVLLCWGVTLDDRYLRQNPQRCIYVAHGEGDWTKLLLEKSKPFIDHVVAVSHRVQQRVCNGYPTSVIYNGVDSARLGQTQTVKSVRHSLGFGAHDFVVGYVGRFSGEKRVEAIIDAVAELPSRYKAMIVGWGPGRQSLMDQANARIPGRYAFLKASEYLGDFYRSMDAVCLVSGEEGFSMAMLEAMMCERPVIATPVGAAPEIIKDRVNGVLVEGTPASIAEAARLLNEHRDWARGVGVEGRRFAEEHGHALRMAREYEQLFHSLCQDA